MSLECSQQESYRSILLIIINQNGNGTNIELMKRKRRQVQADWKNAEPHQDLKLGPLLIMTKAQTAELQGQGNRLARN